MVRALTDGHAKVENSQPHEQQAAGNEVGPPEGGPTDAEQVANLLKTTDGVARVSSKPIEEGVTQYEVRAQGAKDLPETIGQRLINNGFGLRRLERRQNLHDHFMGLMREREETPRSEPSSTAIRPGASPVAAS